MQSSNGRHASVAEADLEIEERVRASLAALERPALQGLVVEVRNGAITFRGRGFLFYEKQIGDLNVWGLEGVDTLVDVIAGIEASTNGESDHPGFRSP